jgi:uncharacterized protein (DUF952 family)
MTIFHITSGADWERCRALGSYTGDTLEPDGFIHCSAEDQVLVVANTLFCGRRDLVLLCIDDDKLVSETRWERGAEGELFPHVYGPLNADAVIDVLDFPPRADGTFDLPAAVRAMN